MSEARFQAELIKDFRAVGAKVLKLVPTIYGGEGWPDLFISHRLWRGWIELKVENNKCDAIQQFQIKGLRDTKTSAFVIRKRSDKLWLEYEDGVVLCALPWEPIPLLLTIVDAEARLKLLAHAPPSESPTPS